jgi:uncharacterized NAD(P)/FAD-binding protein YdhS
MGFRGDGGETPAQTVAVVGGGLSGTVFALKLARARPDLRIVLIEEGRRPGRGLAYGACAPLHLLNVPVSRMETGLLPRFIDWLGERPHLIADALAESGGDLSAAFVQRTLFGAYLQERLAEARTEGSAPGVQVLRGRVASAFDDGRRGVRLEDGRAIEAATVVLATGNLPPLPPGRTDAWFYDTPLFVPDPWAVDAFDDLDPDAPVLLVGTGLTMIDVALKLAERGHTGPMLSVSRRGLVPKAHQAGGVWPPFLKDHIGERPMALLKRVRAEIGAAEAQGVPWQRVFDAARPAIAAIWSRWSLKDRRQFLRHLRARWDIHRHRTAPRIDAAMQGLLESGQLRIRAARLAGFALEGAERVTVTLRPRGGGEETYDAARVVNCTGPASALDQLAIPLIESLRAKGLIKPDGLGLGLESADCALIEASGAVSTWLYALGPLTRPAWWEITATPEIVVQVDRLVARLAAAEVDAGPMADAADAFLDLGAGI